MKTRSIKSYTRAARSIRGRHGASALAPFLMRTLDIARDPWLKYAEQADLDAAERMQGEHF
jgi:hypothetical protein